MQGARRSLTYPLSRRIDMCIYTYIYIYVHVCHICKDLCVLFLAPIFPPYLFMLVIPPQIPEAQILNPKTLTPRTLDPRFRVTPRNVVASLTGISSTQLVAAENLGLTVLYIYIYGYKQVYIRVYGLGFRPQGLNI